MSASSWGCELKSPARKECAWWCSQPLREAVSWKNLFCCGRTRSMVSASSWGCELKSIEKLFSFFHIGQPLREAVSWKMKSVEERVEKGGQPLREAVSWKNRGDGIVTCNPVSLFVRLWVEMLWYPAAAYSEWSASSWGCELKYINIVQSDHTSGQPLREAVSWNMTESDTFGFIFVSLFVRLWVEMQNKYRRAKESASQPLREAVSWNAADVGYLGVDRRQSLREAVSWNTNNLTAINSE